MVFCTLFYLEIEPYHALDVLSSMDAKVSFVRFFSALEINDDWKSSKGSWSRYRPCSWKMPLIVFIIGNYNICISCNIATTQNMVGHFYVEVCTHKMTISNTRFTSKSSILLHWSLGSMRSIRLLFVCNFHAYNIKFFLSPIQFDHIIVIIFCNHQLWMPWSFLFYIP